jgi:thiosulfate/3-mercaptopyruvate sulfurtransferase
MLVSPRWLAANLDRADLVVVHVEYRWRDSYADGHIPGARRATWDDVATLRDGVLNQLPPTADLVALVRRLGIDAGSRVVLYDDGDGIGAARAYLALDYLRLAGRAAFLDGQLAAWRREGRPLSQREPRVSPSSSAPRARPEIVVGLRQMRDIVRAVAEDPDAPYVIVDTRPPAEYRGERGGTFIARGGHIPGAVNVYWKRFLRPSGALRPAEALRRLYTAAGVTPEKLAVACCHSGGQAALAYFTLKYLGYPARVYDGSYLEWSRQADADVTTGPKP